MVRRVPGAGHLDCIFGHEAVRDVFPHILAHLEKSARVAGAATSQSATLGQSEMEESA